MKKHLFITAILVVSMLSVQAQELHLGIKGGANLTKIDGKKFKDNFKLNYYAGGFLEVGISEHFGIQPEVLFSQVSSKTESDFSSIYTEFLPTVDNKELKLNYLNIPVLANIKLSDQFWLQLGPQYSILVDKNKNITENGKAAFKNGDFSAVGGLWLQLTSSLSLNARYTIGLSEINDVAKSDKWKSQAIQLGLGFRLF